jgi:hypothetical protein
MLTRSRRRGVEIEAVEPAVEEPAVEEPAVEEPAVEVEDIQPEAPQLGSQSSPSLAPTLLYSNNLSDDSTLSVRISASTVQNGSRASTVPFDSPMASTIRADSEDSPFDSPNSAVLWSPVRPVDLPNRRSCTIL